LAVVRNRRRARCGHRIDGEGARGDGEVELSTPTPRSTACNRSIILGTGREAVISLRDEVGGSLTVNPSPEGFPSWPLPTVLMRRQALITTAMRTRQHECAVYVTTGCIGIE